MYPEINTLITNYKTDTIFFIKNDVIKDTKGLSFTTNKVIEVIDKTDGYPKYGKFDYSKLQVSFEQLKFEGDTAKCFFLIKTVGLLGSFTFVKNNNIWRLQRYSKGMI